MAVISNLAVSLTAKTSAFTKKLGKVTKSLSRMTKRVGMMGAAFGAAALAGVGFYVKKAFGAIDATAKLADTIGLTTEQLVGYQHAAKIAGISTEEISKGFVRMLKNVSDAGLGLTTAQRAFETLGLNADELKGLKTDEIFKKIADNINNVANASDRVRTFRDLFGRAGDKLLKLTEQGAAGIKKLQAEAVKLGLTYSRIDAGKIEAANDAMQRAKSVLQGVINQIAIKLAPFIEATANKFVELATQADNFGGVMGDTFKGVVDWIKIGSTAITRFQQGVTYLAIAAVNSGGVFVEMLNQIGLGFNKLLMLGVNLENALSKSFKTLFLGINVGWKGAKLAFATFINASVQLFADFLSKIGRGIRSLAPEAGKSLVRAAIEIRGSTTEIAENASKEFTNATKRLKDSADQTGEAFANMFDGIPTKGPLDDVVKTMVKRVDELHNNIKILEEDNSKFLGGLDSTISDIEARASKARKAADTAAGGVSGGAKDATKQRESNFKQISLSRFVLKSQAGTTTKKQKVEAPEFKEMVRLLQQMVDRSVGGAVVQ